MIFYAIESFITAFLLGSIVMVSVIYKVPDIDILMTSIFAITVSAGSIGSIGTVFIIFLGFTFFSIAPVIVALLYHGGGNFDTFAMVLSIYIFIHMISGLKFFNVNRRNIELRKKFKTIYNKSFDGIALIKGHRIIECNNRLAKMFGYKNEEEFLSYNISKFMPHTQNDGELSVKKMLKELKKSSKQTISFEWIQTKKNGINFWVEIALIPIEINKEKIIYGIWRDIDERKKTEDEIKRINSNLEKEIATQLNILRQKDQQLLYQSRLARMGEMISMIAHQWRQPLSAISATSGAINLKAQLNRLDKDMAMELSNKISGYSQHLSSTIEDFRDFFSPNKEKKETSYNEIIQSVLGIIETSIINKNIEIIKELNADNTFNSYPNELKQVVMNLIKNAEDILLEKNIKNPIIYIKTYKQDSKLILEIGDNAGGVPKDILPKIFDPYFSTKTKKDGTGLGLYMSKTIIEEHCSGILSVSNNDAGAVFRVEIEGL